MPRSPRQGHRPSRRHPGQWFGGRQVGTSGEQRRELVTGYVVKSSPGSKTCKTTGAKSCTIRGLRNGTNYSVKVRARSHVGLGAVSAQATVKPGVPLAPRGVRATAGNARATVSWTAPPNNGSAISKYIVKSVPGSKTCTKRAHLHGDGTRNGTHYRFDVTRPRTPGEPGPHRHSPSRSPPTFGLPSPLRRPMGARPTVARSPPSRPSIGLRRRQHPGGPHQTPHVRPGHLEFVPGGHVHQLVLRSGRSQVHDHLRRRTTTVRPPPRLSPPLAGSRSSVACSPSSRPSTRASSMVISRLASPPSPPACRAPRARLRWAATAARARERWTPTTRSSTSTGRPRSIRPR